MNPISETYNMDCMEYMRQLPDKYFELAVVDPEFGIGIAKSARLVTDKGLKAKQWDDKPIDALYFKELFRVSKNQIIWGGNYYSLPPTKHCIIWDKKQPESFSFGMFDFAWTSFNGSNKIFRRSIQLETNKIHPTQKPVALYKWLLHNYAKPGDKILDTHLGSGSSRIAAYDLGFDFYATELDKDYFDAQEKRFQNFKSQLKLF
jgi:site-specific DNA-methyltransferase (adenine-specific)